MANFGEKLRKLRLAQGMGLRETAVAVTISPSYLSRIERGKENPPKPEVIKSLARVLAADPDVLFRHSTSTDPEITALVKESPQVGGLLRLFLEYNPTDEQLEEIFLFAKEKLLARY